MSKRADGERDRDRRLRFLKLRLRELERHALLMEWSFYRMGFFMLSLSEEYPYLGQKMIVSLKKVLLQEAEMINEIYRLQIRRFETINAPDSLLHMLHDNISDILASEQLPAWDAKRAEIYRILNAYYLASADATNPMILKDQEHHH